LEEENIINDTEDLQNFDIFGKNSNENDEKTEYLDRDTLMALSENIEIDANMLPVFNENDINDSNVLDLLTENETEHIENELRQLHTGKHFGVKDLHIVPRKFIRTNLELHNYMYQKLKTRLPIIVMNNYYFLNVDIKKSEIEMANYILNLEIILKGIILNNDNDYWYTILHKYLTTIFFTKFNIENSKLDFLINNRKSNIVYKISFKDKRRRK